MRQPSSGRGPGDADVAAEAHQHARAGRRGGPGRDPVGRQRLRGGAEVERHAAGEHDAWRRPSRRATSRARPAAPGAGRRRRGRCRRSRGRSRAPARRARRSGRPCRRSARRPAARRVSASASSGPTGVAVPACSCSREISESGRNRLQAASIAASSARSTRSAASRASGSVTASRAVVPRAVTTIRAGLSVRVMTRRRTRPVHLGGLGERRRGAAGRRCASRRAAVFSGDGQRGLHGRGGRGLRRGRLGGEGLGEQGPEEDGERGAARPR